MVMLRFALKSWVYATVNVFGLAIGIACGLLIALYISHETSFDTMHSHRDRIYRVSEELRSNGQGQASASVPLPTGPVLAEEYPHLIDHTVRFFRLGASNYLKAEKSFNERHLFFADSSVFDVFDFILEEGNPHQALMQPNHIVISRAMAYRYFGEEPALGKVIRYEDKLDLVVTGVFKDLPSNTHFRFDGLISFSTLRTLLTPAQLSNFYWNPAYTYLLLRDESETTRLQLESELESFMKRYFNEVKVANKRLRIHVLTDLYLHSHYDNEITAGGNISYLYTFATTGILILIIALINFVNLSTARAFDRAKEVGIRKVAGSNYLYLICQFLGESILYASVAMTLAALITFSTLPLLNSFLSTDISFQRFSFFLSH
jgi:putative ABC transport system permease protein